MPERVFLDTAALIALSNSRDSLHLRAREVNAGLAATKAHLVTSDWVLMEFLGAASRAHHRGAGVALVRRLRSSARTTVVAADRTEWDRAFELFASRPDQDWSLVDCSSMLICGQVGIDQVFTSDHHFEQAGLKILLT